MSPTSHLLPEHNSACERARLSTCNCFCHGAGHQLDLLKRAVSCTVSGDNNLAQLLSDLQGVYGGFHADVRDGVTATRRKVPDGLAGIGLDGGRGASWEETLMLDEALHSTFVEISRASTSLTNLERSARKAFVEQLAEGALRIVGRDVDAHNINDGHLWCSILAEYISSPHTPPTTTPQASPFGRICYPRARQVRVPMDLASVRADGFAHVSATVVAQTSLVGLDDILRLMGAASCPDLWHHPAAVRYALGPFVKAVSWPPAGTTSIAKRPRFKILKTRWKNRGNW